MQQTLYTFCAIFARPLGKVSMPATAYFGRIVVGFDRHKGVAYGVYRRHMLAMGGRV